MTLPWVQLPDRLLLECHLQPGAHSNRMVGTHGQRLKIQLKAPPLDGKANALLIRFLAEEFACARSDISIRRGHGSRQKTIQFEGCAKIPAKVLEVVSDEENLAPPK